MRGIVKAVEEHALTPDACEKYCRRQGFEVLERFHEEGESTKTTDMVSLDNVRQLEPDWRMAEAA